MPAWRGPSPAPCVSRLPCASRSSCRLAGTASAQHASERYRSVPTACIPGVHFAACLSRLAVQCPIGAFGLLCPRRRSLHPCRGHNGRNRHARGHSGRVRKHPLRPCRQATPVLHLTQRVRSCRLSRCRPHPSCRHPLRRRRLRRRPLRNRPLLRRPLRRRSVHRRPCCYHISHRCPLRRCHRHSVLMTKGHQIPHTAFLMPPRAGI